MEKTTQGKPYQKIKGWGADLDPANRPGVPMERIPARNTGVHWDELDQQVQKVRVLRSNERERITPIFGTTVPPKGISGKMREFAFKFTESDVRHWFILLLADRINVVEGIVDDISHGHFPNIYKEMGLGAELKHNRAAFIKKSAIAVGLLGLGVVLLQRRRRARRNDNPAIELG